MKEKSQNYFIFSLFTETWFLVLSAEVRGITDNNIGGAMHLPRFSPYMRQIRTLLICRHSFAATDFEPPSFPHTVRKPPFGFWPSHKLAHPTTTINNHNERDIQRPKERQPTCPRRAKQSSLSERRMHPSASRVPLWFLAHIGIEWFEITQLMTRWDISISLASSAC